MRLAGCELRKLACLPALWAFLALCLAFNGLLVATSPSGRGAFNAAGAVTADLGQRVDAAFLDSLAARCAARAQGAEAFNAAGAGTAVGAQDAGTAGEAGSAGDAAAADAGNATTGDAGDAAAAGSAGAAAAAGAGEAGSAAATAPARDEEALLAAARSMEDLYAGYDVEEELAGFYAARVEASPWAVQMMRWKYAQMQPRVEHLAHVQADWDLYAGPSTHDAHQFLFGTLLSAVVGEACLCAMLAMVYLVGYEFQHRTEQVAYASRTGRRLACGKVAAGLLAGMACYALLAAATLGGFFLAWDWPHMMGASVSSQWNYWVESMVARPFLTWADFTVGQYLAACSALGAALVAACGLMAAACGMLARNGYAAALALALLCTGALAARMAFASAEWWPAYYAAMLLPTNVWLSAPAWFTEGGLSAIVPWQESVGAGFGVALFGLACVLAARRFGRKDIVSWNS